MTKNILVFRTDRIGDLLITCPSIKTIKQNFPESELSIITSERNYTYAKTFDFIDNVYLFPKKNILEKIKLFVKLSRKNFDKIVIFDGKDRSIIFSCFLKSHRKVSKIGNKKQAFFCKLFKIKFSYDIFGNDLNDLHQDLLRFIDINNKIENFDYLMKKNDNNFSSKIPFQDFIQIHLDEKWFNTTYIKEYTDINPSFEEFTNFLKSISEKNNILITTGLKTNNLIERLELNSVNKLSKNIFLNNIKENIILVKNPSFLDLESLLRKTKVLISCHGALTHAAASFNIKIIDIVEESKDELVKRYSLYIKDYYKIYREKFSVIKNKINNII